MSSAIEIITMEKIGEDEIGTDYEIQFKTETAYNYCNSGWGRIC